MTISSHILGYPRIGVNRQTKTAVEAYWKGELTREQLDETGRKIQETNWQTQKDAGLTFVTVGDFCWYDHILNTSVMFDVIPDRFRQDAQDQKKDAHMMNTMFCMGRGQAPGTREAPACEMTKWFNTNYHYMVPELIQNQQFKLNPTTLISDVEHAQKLAYSSIKPVIVGPITYLYMAKTKLTEFNKYDLLPKLITVYQELLEKLAKTGVKWVQIDEPILGLDLSPEILTYFTTTYQKLKQPGLKLMLTTYFTGLFGDNMKTAINLAIDGLHLDLIAAPEQLSDILDKVPSSLTLSLGLINGRNIWKADLARALQILSAAKTKLGASDRLWVASSCSLLHCPVDLDAETKMDAEIKNWLAFSKQKTIEIALLAKAANQGQDSIAKELSENQKAVESRRTSTRIHNPAVKQRCANLPADYDKRHSAYPSRALKQRQALKLPLFPTTTIGSFPQTKEIRAARAELKAGKITQPQYVERIKAVTIDVIRKQEELDLDVLVHGEAERNDMVEYFGELLSGYTFSQNGWVQSYGSRCVKPPIIFGDVSRPTPMTIEWIRFAQENTKRLMKGMLTGPVTMLAWSFVRDDQPISLTSLQLALALRDEIVDLETNGIKVIQLDEPAFREALPLRRKDWPEYLRWSVHSFRVATSGVRDETQIHTHMCYSEFNDVIDSIAALDADVITIESSRSDMELLRAFEHFHYPNEIGPGVYDIHSPNVPTVEFMVKQLEIAAKFIPAERLWMNPDCGLKTRGWPETIQALKNMVDATKVLRQKYKK